MLNPEKLTLLDPACGSGHILVEAYDLFKAIYTERGYPKREIPRLILEKNLFGLEIDDRAAQLASFALMMKARADDRRIFESGVKPNILAFQESQGLNAADIARALNAPINKDDVPREFLFEEMQEERDGLFSQKAMAEKGHVSPADIAALVELFENAKTFGSLIQVPPKLAAKLPEIEKRLADVLKHGDLTHASAHVLKPLLQQAQWLARQYDAVVANPPYMGSKSFNPVLKSFVGKLYNNNKSDIYAAFIQRSFLNAKPTGFVGMITMRSWMFLPSFQSIRSNFIENKAIFDLVFIGYNSFPELNSKIALAVAFSIKNSPLFSYVGTYLSLNHAPQTADKNQVFLSDKRTYLVDQNEFKRIPEHRFAFWASKSIKLAFDCHQTIETQAPVRQGFQTGDNDIFLRYWYEVDRTRITCNATRKEDVFYQGKKWVPYHKGGVLRKWYGNHDHIVAFDKKSYELLLRSGNCLPSRHLYFKEGITWSSLTSSLFGARYSPAGFTFSAKGACAFPKQGWLEYVLALLNSNVVAKILEILAATLDFNVGSIREIPLIDLDEKCLTFITENTGKLIDLARIDWDSYEYSCDFKSLPIFDYAGEIIREIFNVYEREFTSRIKKSQKLEIENNQLLIEVYGLQGELSPEVPDDQITLYRPNREEDIKRLLSYAIGCMMGRYRLDQPGLIYAHSGNVAFEKIYFATETHGINTEKTQDLSSSVSFPCPSVAKFLPDQDGIIPLLTTDWGFPDDATTRLVEFTSVAWPKEHLEENLKFIADSLGSISNEQPRDTIRRYFAAGFYKHHLTIYKRRPIYWLFASGKQRAFQCLVYLHRYHDGTLARMRTEYVIPLQGRIAARIDQLEGDKAEATSTSHRKKLQKEQDDLKKQQAELLTFEEKLKHAADQKISLDLDDGVKVNYGKFGELLAETKAITGGKDED